MPERSAYTTISDDMLFKGEVEFEDVLVIEGQLEGVVRSHGKVYILPSGNVKADLYVHQLVIEGRLQGNVHGADLISIHKTGYVYGDLDTRELEVERGGKHLGRTTMK
ncbi:MAG: polymer-forming cytoskeletal protein [Leptospiraceae bacterium]|nr:polymer-forming cytoskeletal protein [Leptospiraceae bacterium]MDW8305476.1 polymer-forming cytoskeletal protein [Leptospiraceae bacterium]